MAAAAAAASGGGSSAVAGGGAAAEGDDITFVSADGERFAAARAVAFMSGYARNMVAEATEALDVVVPAVDTATLAKVMEFCNYHVDKPLAEFEKPLKSGRIQDVLCPWDVTFIDLDQAVVCALALAASFLDINPLLEVATVKVACMIKGKTPEQLRTLFHIPNTFTPEEEAKIIDENKWCAETE